MPVTAHVIKARSLEMRKNMTESEAKLWFQYLRKAPWKFRRQSPVGYYILDFFCPALRLAIEVDGEQHATLDGQAYDEGRTAVLNQVGIEVIRFMNAQVDSDFDAVCQRIAETCSQRSIHYRTRYERMGVSES